MQPLRGARPLVSLWQRHPYGCVVALALLLRVLWLGVAFLGVPFQLPADNRFMHVTDTGLGYNFTPNQALDLGLRSDAVFYLTIAQHGYVSQNPDDLRTAFFPLYPALVAAVQRAVPWTLIPTALLVANLCDLAGWMLVASLARRRLGTAPALAAVLAFALFPTRNFGFAAYTEGVFLALSAAAFYLVELRRGKSAAVACALLSAVRPQGILVGAALGLDALWRAVRRQKDALPWSSVASFGLAPAGLVAYMGYLAHHVGDPLAFAHVQANWKRQFTLPLRALWAHGDPQDHAAMWLAVGLTVAMIAWRAPLRDWLYCAMALLLPMSTGSVQSMARFVGVLFPLFIFAAGAVPPRGRVARTYAAVAVVLSLLVAFKLGRGVKIT